MTRRSISIPGFVSVEEAEGTATPCNAGMLRTFISGSPNWSLKAKYRDEARFATLIVLLDPGQHILHYLLDGAKVAFRYLRVARSRRKILGIVAHERRQPDGALSAPFRETVFGYSLGQFLVGDGDPERGPGARDDAPDVVASAAGCDPAASAELVGQVVYPVGHVLVEAGRCKEMCQGVEGMAVAAVLGEDEVRVKGAKGRGDHALEARDPGLVVRKGLERHVDGVADTAVTALLIDPAATGEEVAARLVHGDCQDVGIAVEHPLHTVAVVGVGIDVGNADAGILLF